VLLAPSRLSLSPLSLSSAHTTNSSSVSSAVRTSPQTNAISLSFKYFELPNSHQPSVHTLKPQVYKKKEFALREKIASNKRVDTSRLPSYSLKE
jgi:hypothetical protein